MRRLSEIPWKTTSTRPIYQNRWLSLREDLVELPNGRTTIYGVVSCGECVGVLPFLDPDTVLLIRQYRYVAGRTTWEFFFQAEDGIRYLTVTGVQTCALPI